MIRTNFFTVLACIGLFWLAISGLLAYDCSGETLWSSAINGLGNTSVGQQGSAEACELSRVKAIAGDTGVRIWTSLPTGIVALVLVQLLRRHLSSSD